MKERLLKLYGKHSRLWLSNDNIKSRLYHGYMQDRLLNILFGRYGIALDKKR